MQRAASGSAVSAGSALGSLSAAIPNRGAACFAGREPSPCLGAQGERARGSTQQPALAPHPCSHSSLPQPAPQPTGLFHQPQSAKLGGKAPKNHQTPPPVTFPGFALHKMLRAGAVLDSAGKGEVRRGSILLI